jgi:hypothetical protein
VRDLNLTGYWWLPTEKDPEWLGGTLTFRWSTGVRLELLGMFKQLAEFFAEDISYPIVHGVTTEGQKATLVDCQDLGGRYGSGVPTQSLQAGLLLIGDHVGADWKQSLSRVVLRFSGLEDWVQETGVRQVFPSTRRGDDYGLLYRRPRSRTARLPEGLLTLGFGWSSGSTQFRDATIREHAAFDLRLRERSSFRDIVDRYVGPLQNFLALCVDEPNQVTELHVFPESKPGRDGLEVFYAQLVEPASRKRPLIPVDMLLPARDLGSSYSRVLRDWLRASSELRSVFSLFFAVRTGRRLFLESRFLNLVQAAEVFHRHVFPNRVISRSAHRKRIRDIVDSAPSEHRGWVRDALAFSNEPRLLSRLMDLLALTGRVSFLSQDERETMAKRIRDTRNYFVHYDPALKAKAEQGERLYWLSERVNVLMATCLLKHVGVSDRRIRHALDRNRAYQFARRRWSQLSL